MSHLNVVLIRAAAIWSDIKYLLLAFAVIGLFYLCLASKDVALGTGILGVIYMLYEMLFGGYD